MTNRELHILLICLVFGSLAGASWATVAVSAQEGCIPVGDRPASVEICDTTLQDGTVSLDFEANGQQTVYVALVASSKTQGSVSTVERTLTGNETLTFPAPSGRSVRWSVATLDGFAFGEVGSTVDVIDKDPTWTELFTAVAGAVSGVVINVFVAVFIVLRGKDTHITQIW